jgi:hypothetical protein
MCGSGFKLHGRIIVATKLASAFYLLLYLSKLRTLDRRMTTEYNSFLAKAACGETDQLFPFKIATFMSYSAASDADDVGICSTATASDRAWATTLDRIIPFTEPI